MEGVEVTPMDAEQALVLRLIGTLGPETASAALARLVDATVTLPPPHLVILDLRDVETLSAAGVRALGEFAAGRARAGVRSAVLLDPGALNARILRGALPGDTLPVHAGVDEAIEGEGTEQTSEERLGGQLAALTRVLLNASTVTQALNHVVAATTVIVPHARLVSITLRDAAGRFFTPVEIPETAADLDDVQYRSGSGPCLDAAAPGGPAYALDQDLARSPAWPRFAAAATAHGLGAVLSTALLPTSRPAGLTGALNIYAHREGITSTDRHRALLLATHASLALEHARVAELAELERAHLRRALESRDVIGQAKGILMARQGLSADAAFTLLRHTSQELNVKLTEIAAALVDNRAALGRED
ncbi:ANTAR domain-containing protein [Amycolatopsis pretoriensis]|uniref:ANTAR domain-containing protein n=1 Tax=Amycolatopsis pretoriensis TaxID=218821 RepID=A0A1H5Q258_9PSEU|nr:ANTAR domain-containing protein [Amycolatopsis pretoriensis]SEF20004.1 ANTAR domain-containing protein [Amycolatopsis pretoriensis]